MPGADVNAYVFDDEFFAPTGDGNEGWLGRTLTRYDVARIRDVRNLGSAEAYQVRCTIRLRVFPVAGYRLQRDASAGWKGYPSAVINTVAPAVGNAVIELVDYTPKTINSSVNSDSAYLKSAENSVTRQHTAGSATTVTNSFGASVGADAKGPNASVHYDHSQMSETRDESMDAAIAASSSQTSVSTQMTIKDWGALASLSPGLASLSPGDADPARVQMNPTWTWAQEYPWNAIAMRPGPAARCKSRRTSSSGCWEAA